MNAPLTKEQWAKLRADSVAAMPDVIAKVGLPKVLLGYQGTTVELLNSASTGVLVIEKSRRIGLTWGLGAHAALTAGKAREAGGMDVLYISYSQDMTREFIDACAMWARAFSVAAFEADEFLFEDETVDGTRSSIQALRIRFASGFEIVALSSAPRSLRGKQGLVIIDEAAFVDNLKELLKAALALRIWGGQVVICSTHDGTENPFNELVQDVLAGRRKGFKHRHIDFDQALKDGLYQRICLVNGLDWSPDAEAEWRQDIIDTYGDGADEELFCIPAQGSGTWLSAPLIEARMTEPPETILRLELPADFLHLNPLRQSSLMHPFVEQVDEKLDGLDKAALYALGFDFGRVADLSVVALLAITQSLKRPTRLVIEMRRTPYAEQKQIVRRVIKALPGMIGAAFDNVGAGAEVAETMGRLFGFAEPDKPGGLVHRINLSETWYREEMPPLKAAFEDDIIALPKDVEILADLRLVKVIRGVPKIPDVRTGEKGKRRHGDAAVALALAYYASRQQAMQYGYLAATSARTMTGNPGADPFDDPNAGLNDRNPFRPPLGARISGSI